MGNRVAIARNLSWRGKGTVEETWRRKGNGLATKIWIQESVTQREGYRTPLRPLYSTGSTLACSAQRVCWYLHASLLLGNGMKWKEMELRNKREWHERVLAKHRTCAYVSHLEWESEFCSSEGYEGIVVTYARGGLWPSCLRISLARENQSAVVRLTTGEFVCLCFLGWMTLMFLLRCCRSLHGVLRVTVLQ